MARGSVTAAGTVSGGEGMALYDANQSAAAVTALSRALVQFWTQDDSPAVNSSADADFLAGRIYSHISSIISAVVTAVSTAQFELLWPYDANYSSCYSTAAAPYPIGGRLIYAINLPSQFGAMSGSGLNRFKTEGLSWQSEYFNLTNFIETVLFPYTVLSWSQSDTACLIAWDNGACAWAAAWLFCVGAASPLVNLWAIDHAVLYSWPAGMPAATGSAAVR